MPLPLTHESEPASEAGHDSYKALPTPSGRTSVTDSSHLLPAETGDPGSKGSPWKKILFLVIFLALIGVVVWRIHSNNVATTATNTRTARDNAGRATPVMVTPVVQTTVPVYLTALGTVTAYNTVTLHSRVDGQLLKVNFQEGQAVKQGQLLIQIDPRPYQATVDQASGTLAKDEATLANTQAEAQRYTALYQAGVVSKESQQTQLTNAGQASGVIKADQAAIEAAKVNLGYTRIYSPIDGVVGLRGVDPGNIVHASDATGLVVITQVHPIAVIFTLPEDQLPQVQQAMRGGSKLVAEAFDRGSANKLGTGTLLTIDNQIDTTTGTAKLKAVFPNTDNALFPNQFVNIRLVLAQRQNAIVIPTAAIQSGTQGTFVFVARGGAGLPGGRRGGGGAGGGGGGRRNGGAGAGANGGGGNPSGSTAPGGSPAGGGAPAGTPGAPAGANGGAPRPTSHVNAVNVHVDFVQGANSILSPGQLKAGDLVVVDGQERLTDGSNVTPQIAPAGGNATVTGGAPSDTSTGAPAAPNGQPNGRGVSPANGQPVGSNAAPGTGTDKGQPGGGNGGHRRQGGADGQSAGDGGGERPHRQRGANGAPNAGGGNQ